MRYGFRTVIFFPLITLILFCTSVFARVSEIALKQKDAVVTIFALEKDRDSLGSGFIISKEGIVVTNYHVSKYCVENATCIVKMENGAFFPVVGVIGVDEENDLALVKIKGKGLPTAKLAKEHSGKLGESVVVIGSPKGLETTVSDGIVSAIRGDGDVLQITAPISPGSSGSPVFNSKGEVIGVATFTIKESQNLNFAIPVKFVHNLFGEYTASSKTSFKKPIKRAVEPKPAPPNAQAKADSPKMKPPKPDEPPPPDPAEAKRTRINNLIQKAKTELSQNRFREAVESCNAAIEIESNMAELFSLRSEAYNNLGLYTSALTDADRAIDLDPHFYQAHVNRGHANEKLGKYEDAIKAVDLALTLNPSIASAYSVRSSANNMLGNFHQALSDANRGISIDRTIPVLHSNRGFVLYALGKPQEALDNFSAAININPNLYAAYGGRCDVYGALGKYDQALRDCNEAIRLNQHDYKIYSTRGTIYFLLKDYNRAHEDFSLSIGLKAWDLAYQLRCMACIELGKYDEAVRDCTNAIELNSQQSMAYGYRALAFLKIGDKKQAVTDAQIAARMGLKLAQDILAKLGIEW